MPPQCYEHMRVRRPARIGGDSWPASPMARRNELPQRQALLIRASLLRYDGASWLGERRNGWAVLCAGQSPSVDADKRSWLRCARCGVLVVRRRLSSYVSIARHFADIIELLKLEAANTDDDYSCAASGHRPGRHAPPQAAEYTLAGAMCVIRDAP